MPDNLRHAQYGNDGVQIDDPQTVSPNVSQNIEGLYSDKAVANASLFKKILYVGDSIVDSARTNLVATSVTHIGNNRARVVRTSHSQSVGLTMSILGASDPRVNVVLATVDAVIDANTFEVTLNGPVHTVTGNSPVLAYNYKNSCLGWVNWYEGAFGQPVQRLWAAMGGARILSCAGILASLPVEQADAAKICIGMNDIYADTATLAQMQIDFAVMMKEVLKRSAKIEILSVPPRDSGNAAWTAGKQNVHTAWNRWLYEQCMINGWAYLHTWRCTQDGVSYVNSAATNPDPNASMSFDGVHPSMRGAAAIGAAIAAKDADWFGTQGWEIAHPAEISTITGNLLSGSDFSTNVAGVATGWSRTDVTASMTAVYTTAARTIAADGDACGFNQVMTINYGAAAGTASCRFRKDNIQALLTPGVVYQFIVHYKVTDAVGLVGLELNMSGTRADGTFWFITGMSQNANVDPIIGDFEGWLISPAIVCPNNLSDLDIWVRPYINSTQVADVIISVDKPAIWVAPLGV